MPSLAFRDTRPNRRNRHDRRKPGFTLIDLMIALALGASLAAVAWPGYAEQWRSTHAGYTDNLGQRDGLALSTDDTALSYLTHSGHHRIRVVVEPLTASTRYVVTAVPEAPHLDPGCASLSLMVDGGVVRRAVTPQGQLHRCWRP
jgi:prepilin-type N-terminal cleavage/methylation domain-containing protein